MHIDFLREIFNEHSNNEAIIWKGVSFNYQWISNKLLFAEDFLKNNNINPGDVVCLEADFSPNGIAFFLALIKLSCIIVPLDNNNHEINKRKYDIAQVQHIIHINDTDEVTCFANVTTDENCFYQELRKRCVPGLVLFTSGTSGVPKAAVHDFSRLLEKFHTKRKSLKTLNFLLFDHWGGLNTLLHTLSNAGVVVAINDRSPDGICALIAKHAIEVLPASPTFLNLLLISEAYKRYDLSSLKVISYGTEPMSEATLARLVQLLPWISFKQTYGLIELGVLRSQSKNNSSLWVKIGGDGYETRVVDGILQIKAASAMLGYLNAPSPFTTDGFFITGDAVEVEGEYLKILGRKSELINVGGEKVYPIEVENVIRAIENVADVVVYGEKNQITGNIVCAKINLVRTEDKKDSITKIRKECISKLEGFKVPIKIKIVSEPLFSGRYKMVRHSL